jgi:uncharacterized protein (DUF1778 family)
MHLIHRVMHDQKRASVPNKKPVRAAMLSTRTLSEFVVASTQEAATRIIQEHEAIQLSRKEQINFVAMLLDPPPPHEKLRAAATLYRASTAT